MSEDTVSEALAGLVLPGSEDPGSPDAPLNVELLKPAIVRMKQSGLDDSLIAAMLNVDHVTVKQVVTVRRVAPEDEELADAARNFLLKSYRQALFTLDFGTSAERMALMKVGISAMMRQISGETSAKFEEMRTEFEGILSDMRGGDEDDDEGTETGAFAIDFDDPDERTDY